MRFACLVFTLLTACGTERVQSRIVCFDDQECPTGTICGDDAGECVPILADDVRNRPPPADAGALYARFAHMLPAFDSGEQTLRYPAGAEIGEPVEEAEISLRVSESGRLHVWGFSAVSRGGQLPFWPVALEVRKVAVQISDEYMARLVKLEYPAARAELTVPVRVVTTVADSAGTTLDVTSTLEDARLVVALSVTQGAVARRILVKVSLTAEGAGAPLQVAALAANATFIGNEVPREWLPEDDTQASEVTDSAR